MEPDEAAAVLDATLRDLGLDPLDRMAAVLSVARALGEQTIGDDGAAREVAPIVWALFAAEPLTADWPPAFVRLAMAADAVEDLPWLEGSMPEFMAAARAFVGSTD